MGDRSRKKKKKQYIQDLSDPSDRDHVSAEYDHDRYSDCTKDSGNAAGVFRWYDESSCGEQKGDPAE